MDTSPHILIVDDNRGDALLLSRALRAVLGDYTIGVVHTGEMALTRLRAEGEYAGLPLPRLMLLDCRLPRLDGFQVLDAVRTDPSLISVRVVLMSGLVTSTHLEDGARRGAAGHIEKPDHSEGFRQLAEALAAFLHDESESLFRFPGTLSET